MMLTSEILLNKLKELDVSGGYSEKQLREDMEHAEREVLALEVCKTQAQLDALVSFVLSQGIATLKDSHLLRLLQADWPKSVVVKEWKRWSRDGGTFVHALERRRAWEVVRFYDNSPTLEEVMERLANPHKNKDMEYDDFNDRPY